MKPDLACLHCGKESAPAEAFCCGGCSAAYSLIQGSKLADFYTLQRDKKPVNTLEIDSAFFDSKMIEKNTTSCAGSVKQVTLVIENITCSACSWLLEKVPLIEPGVLAVQVSPATKSVIVQYEEKLGLPAAAQIFYSLGYPVHFKNKKLISALQIYEMRRIYIQTAIAFACMIATMHLGLSLIAGILDGMELTLVKGLGMASLILSLPSVLYSAKSFYRNAWLAIKIKRANVDLLVTVAIVVGFFSSAHNLARGINQFYFDAVTMLIALLLGGRLIVREMENRFQIGKVNSLNDILADSNLKEGDVLIVKSGATFSCDGTVSMGQSHMDASWLTGESLPVMITKGSLVYAGAINKGDEIEIIATSVGIKTRAGKVLQLLETVEKGSLVRFSEKAEQILVTLSLLGIGTFAIFTINSGSPNWNTLIALILVICPCALGLAVPTATAAALGQALERGLLIKGAAILEKVSDITAIVFDKTGTLTSSEYTLLQELWQNERMAQMGLTMKQTVDIIYSMAQKSNHVLSRSIARHLEKNATPLADLSAEEIFGRGILGKWQGHEIKLGSAQFVKEYLQSISIENNTRLYCSIDSRVVVQFDLKPKIETHVSTVVSELSKSCSLYLLSGDEEKPVKALAMQVGIPPHKAHFQKTPEEKLQFIEGLSKTKKVMMIPKRPSISTQPVKMTTKMKKRKIHRALVPTKEFLQKVKMEFSSHLRQSVPMN